MASKTIDHMDMYVAIAPYEHQGQKYNELNVTVAYRKGVGFNVHYHPGYDKGNGVHTCIFDFSKDPLTSTTYVEVKAATKNSVKTLEQMRTNLEQATDAIAWLFDHRDWTRLQAAVKNIALFGYHEKFRQQMEELMAAMTSQTADETKQEPEDSPMMKQFKELKKKHPEAMLLFRCGDFYEAYEDDAKECARVLGITLTYRQTGKQAMAGFPHHALDQYLPKLIRAGKRIAICDQLDDPKLTKRLVKQGITEIINDKSTSQNNNTVMNNNKQTNESKNAAQQQVTNEVESVAVGEVTLASILPAMQPVEGSEYQVKDSEGKDVTFSSSTPNIGYEPTKQEVAQAISKAATEGTATTMPLGTHGTLVIAGVGGEKKVTDPAPSPAPTMGGECPADSDGAAAPLPSKGRGRGGVTPAAETLPRLTLVVYETRRHEKAPRIEGFAGEDDPRWKRHHDEKVRLKALKEQADKKNEALKKQMKGKTKAEKEALMKRWVVVPNDPFNASYFTDRTTGEKSYSLVMGAKYLDVALQLVDAYNTPDRDLWAQAEQAVADVKQGIVAEKVAEREARKQERAAQREAQSATTQPAAQQPTVGYTDEQVAAMLMKMMAGGELPAGIKEAMAKAA